jgi:hypothetical protein
MGKKIVLDAGRLLDAIDRAVDVAWKLTGKLEGTESPRDRFFIKQELVNGQEALRNLVQAASLTGGESLGFRRNLTSSTSRSSRAWPIG